MKLGFLEEHGRKFIGVGLVTASIFGALGLAAQADTSVAMWGTKYSIGPGVVITAHDLQVMKVSLGKQSAQYFSQKAKLVGSYLTRNLGQGELIPVSAISASLHGENLQQIPLGISKSDLPMNLQVGDLVDLYSLPTKDPKAITSLITPKVRVAGIDSQSQNIGGVIDLLLSVDSKVVTLITDAIQMGRIVVVRNEI